MTDANFGKYRLLAELGHGGMADVYLAVVEGFTGSGFSKLVVVKRLRQNLAEDSSFVTMLMDEARIAARLNHPNVAQTNEVGMHEKHYFISMEYIDGQPLNRIQSRATKRSLPFRELQYQVIVDMLAGLHHAHELVDYDGSPLGIVHRDVTPHNVLVSYEGQVKLVDFGIAKAERRLSQTETGVVKGKVRYMSPEQVRGVSLDRRADLFAAGIMLWEAATEKRFWGPTDDVALIHSLVQNDFNPSPRAADPNVPESIDRICRKALAYHRNERYATAAEFRLDLEKALLETGRSVELRAELGPFVSGLFDDQRKEIREIIEKQLAQVENSGLSPVALAEVLPSSATPVSKTTAMEVESPSLDGSTRALQSTSSDDIQAAEIISASHSADREPSKPRRWMNIGLLGAAALGLMAFGVTRARMDAAAPPSATHELPPAPAALPPPQVTDLPSALPAAAVLVAPTTETANPTPTAQRTIVRTNAPVVKPIATVAAPAVTVAPVATVPLVVPAPFATSSTRKNRPLDAPDKIF